MNDRPTRDPYATGQAVGRRDWPHSPVEARIVAVLKDHREGRGLRLILPRTRAVRTHDIHEFMMTDEATAGPGADVDGVSYIAFAEIIRGGMVVEGDRVAVSGHRVGVIAGFDETHMPNHLNVVMRGPVRHTGRELKARLGDLINIIPVFETFDDD